MRIGEVALSSLEELLRGQVLAGESFAVIDPSERGKALVEVYRLGRRTCAVPSASHELRTTIESNGGGPGIERDSLGSGHGGECSERCACRALRRIFSRERVAVRNKRC